MILGPPVWFTDCPRCFADTPETARLGAATLVSSTWALEGGTFGIVVLSTGCSFITCLGSLHMVHLSTPPFTSSSASSIGTFLNLQTLHLHSPCFASTPPPIFTPCPGMTVLSYFYCGGYCAASLPCIYCCALMTPVVALVR